MKALERPSYLNKSSDVKVWEVQVEKARGEVSFNCFIDMQQAKQFTTKHQLPFYPDDFKWVHQSELALLRGLKKKIG